MISVLTLFIEDGAEGVLEHCACVEKVIAHERQPERLLRCWQRSLVRLAGAPAKFGNLVEAKKRAGEPSPSIRVLLQEVRLPVEC